MDCTVNSVITTRIMVFQHYIPDLFSITFDLDIFAHIVGGFKRRMIIDFTGSSHSACKYIAGEASPVETFDPAFKTRKFRLPSDDGEARTCSAD